jgi:WD40 repeat protein
MKSQEAKSEWARIFAMCVFTFPSLGLLLALGCSASGQNGKREPDKELHNKSVCVKAADFSPDNKLLIVALGPNGPQVLRGRLPQQRAMQLWDVESGKLLHTFWPDERAHRVFFFDGGKKIFASDYTSVRVFDGATRAMLARYQWDAWPLGMMPDGKQLLAFTKHDMDYSLELREAATGKVIRKFRTNTLPKLEPPFVSVSSDGKLALVPCGHGKKGIDEDTTLQLWDLSKGEVKIAFDRKRNLIDPLCFSPDEKFALAQWVEEWSPVGKHKFSLVLLETATGKVVRKFESPSNGTQLVAYSQEGKELVILDVFLRPVETESATFAQGAQLRRLQIKTGKESWSVLIKTNDETLPVSVFSPDATRLFVGNGTTLSSLKGHDVDRLQMEIWDAVKGKKLHTLVRQQPK